MKKINYWLLTTGLYLLCSLSMNAQVSVSDSTNLGTSLNTSGTDSTEVVGQTTVNNTNVNTSNALLPGNKHLVDFCDEIDSNDNFANAVVSYIDENGYYYQVSDATYKENITTLNASLSKIVKLRGVEYNHKTKSNANNSNNKKSGITTEPKALRFGFLAQEVETIIPEAVETGISGKKFINYQAMIPLLIEAMKEQQTKIDKQGERIQVLESQISAIQKSVKLK